MLAGQRYVRIIHGVCGWVRSPGTRGWGGGGASCIVDIVGEEKRMRCERGMAVLSLGSLCHHPPTGGLS